MFLLSSSENEDTFLYHRLSHWNLLVIIWVTGEKNSNGNALQRCRHSYCFPFALSEFLSKLQAMFSYFQCFYSLVFVSMGTTPWLADGVQTIKQLKFQRWPIYCFSFFLAGQKKKMFLPLKFDPLSFLSSTELSMNCFIPSLGLKDYQSLRWKTQTTSLWLCNLCMQNEWR